MSDLPDMLRLTDMGEGRFEVTQPAETAEGRDVVCGNIIGLAMSAHRDKVDIHQAHRTLNTGVIGHTIHFVEPFDVSRWLLLAHWADKAASGRVLGRGQVFTRDGELVAEFSQDAMAKTSDREVNWQHAI